ncbi:LacI family DNA-binding transcriptional regulator [Herbiconiux sp. KACC 21604]|uniref:LacI family DNA-binding transcriptional regulator n=1 Tax=unclassified Herbiconiux TaxID=2618217 RepID=UPI001490EF8E|nr:LacI family DNA-binding transcriptional regulator [Herbiconiux sp. SALV-R1]QJU52580.1 LacI family DNA-binding transcriptional regulator [Herbiconiux sp. SALV-R1]WPO87465.1 LacI family DNA-binding transcriptional regulator [Herbiconiux sp. KACC 21604]
MSIADVAKRARVSVGTVSNALNHPERVSNATLRRVRTAIDELGWTPSGRARKAPGRLETMGVVLVDASSSRAAVLEGIQERIRRTDVEALTAFTDGDGERVRGALNAFERLGMHSVILESGEGTDQLAEALTSRGTTVVIAGATGSPRLSSAAVDDESASRLAIEHLLAGGRRRIVLAHDGREAGRSADRAAAARATVTEAGLDPDAVLIEQLLPGAGAAGGRAASEFLLDRRVLFDALVFPDDASAIGAWQNLDGHGRAVPDDVAVVGCGDSAESSAVGITSVRLPLHAVGYHCADMLLAQRRDPRSARVRQTLPVDLVIRKSSR